MMAQLSQWVIHYGAWGVFFAAFTEEVVVPIPSALVMMSAGFFLLGAQAVSAGSALYLLTNVALPIAAGLTLGSLVTYGLAWRFGRPIIERWGRYIGVSWADVEKLERYFARGWADEAVLFGLRLVPIIPSVVINIFCGLTRFSFWRYLVLTFVGIVARAYLVAFIGWQLGELYYRYAHYFSRLENLGLILVVGLVALWLWRRQKNNYA